MEQDNISSDLSVIEVSGVDSLKFLQGQLTNDINQLEQKPFQFSAHLNNKGRMLASFIITKIAPDTYYLITTAEIIDKIIPRLKMYVLRSKVSITKLDYTIILSNITPASGIVLEIVPEHYLSLNKNPSVGADSYLWKNLLINHGLPLIYLTTSEAFIPQHVNYDLLGGVNFKKGCYTGQEIVARTHYLGKVKQRMYRFICDFIPTIGQKVVSPKYDNQEIGMIVDVVKREYNFLGLVSLKSDCVESAFLDTENKMQLLIQAIEYPAV